MMMMMMYREEANNISEVINRQFKRGFQNVDDKKSFLKWL